MTWTPHPGDRVLIRNAGEYGHCYEDRAEVEYLGTTWLPKRRTENVGSPWPVPWLVQVYDGVNVGEFTVLRSDLSPVEPPRLPATMGWGPTYEPDYPPWTTAPPSFERHTGPETEESRRLTKEDYDDIERARKEAIVSEWLIEQLELIDPKLAESYRARTRKERDFS